MSTENYAVLGADEVSQEPDDSLAIRPEEMGEAAPEPVDAEASSANEEPNHESNDQKPEPEEQQAGESGESQAPEAQPEQEPEAEPESVAAGAGSGTGTESESESESAGNSEPLTVPKARLDKALRDKRALEQRLQQFQQQQPAPQQPPAQSAEASPPAPELEQADLPSSKEIAEALLDGDLEKYSELMDKRDAARDQQLIQQVNKSVPQQVSQEQNRMMFDQTRAEVELKFPMLDSNSEEFSQELTDTVVTFAASYRERGYTPSDALQMAAEKVMKVEHPELFHVEQEAAPAKPDPKVEQLKQERMNIDQKLKAAAAQSPKVTAAAVDDVDPIPDFTTMRDEDFDKLSPAQLDEYMSRMRDQRLGR